MLLVAPVELLKGRLAGLDVGVDDVARHGVGVAEALEAVDALRLGVVGGRVAHVDAHLVVVEEEDAGVKVRLGEHVRHEGQAAVHVEQLGTKVELAVYLAAKAEARGFLEGGEADDDEVARTVLVDLEVESCQFTLPFKCLH